MTNMDETEQQLMQISEALSATNARAIVIGGAERAMHYWRNRFRETREDYVGRRRLCAFNWRAYKILVEKISK